MKNSCRIIDGLGGLDNDVTHQVGRTIADL